MSAYQIVMLLFAGAAATGGQLSITKAYTKAPAKEISVFDYSQVIFAALAWIVLFTTDTGLSKCDRICYNNRQLRFLNGTIISDTRKYMNYAGIKYCDIDKRTGLPYCAFCVRLQEPL